VVVVGAPGAFKTVDAAGVPAAGAELLCAESGLPGLEQPASTNTVVATPIVRIIFFIIILFSIRFVPKLHDNMPIRSI
jgi:hypothetical protein